MSGKKKHRRKDTSELDPIRVSVPAWLADKNNIAEDLSGHLVAETQKAILVRVTEEQEVWLPKSQIRKLPLPLDRYFVTPPVSPSEDDMLRLNE